MAENSHYKHPRAGGDSASRRFAGQGRGALFVPQFNGPAIAGRGSRGGGEEEGLRTKD